MKPEPKLPDIVDRLRIVLANLEREGDITIAQSDILWLDDAIAEIERLRTPPSAAPSADAVYTALAHGDDTHRAWLREAVDALFAGRAVPMPRAAIPPSADVREPTEAREMAIRCLDNLAIDPGAKVALIERIVAAMGDARREALEQAAKVADGLARMWFAGHYESMGDAAQQVAGAVRALSPSPPAEET